MDILIPRTKHSDKISIKNFMYLFLAALGLNCGLQALDCNAWDFSLVATGGSGIASKWEFSN